jgi:hypothetical protein
LLDIGVNTKESIKAVLNWLSWVCTQILSTTLGLLCLIYLWHTVVYFPNWLFHGDTHAGHHCTCSNKFAWDPGSSPYTAWQIWSACKLGSLIFVMRHNALYTLSIISTQKECLMMKCGFL